jgi:hypothetical protein
MLLHQTEELPEIFDLVLLVLIFLMPFSMN